MLISCLREWLNEAKAKAKAKAEAEAEAWAEEGFIIFYISQSPFSHTAHAAHTAHFSHFNQDIEFIVYPYKQQIAKTYPFGFEFIIFKFKIVMDKKNKIPQPIVPSHQDPDEPIHPQPQMPPYPEVEPGKIPEEDPHESPPVEIPVVKAYGWNEIEDSK